MARSGESLKAEVQNQANANRKYKHIIRVLKAQNEKLRALLLASTERMESLLENQRDCGDPDAECPLQDAHKDWHIAGLVKRNRAALKGGEA